MFGRILEKARGRSARASPCASGEANFLFQIYRNEGEGDHSSQFVLNKKCLREEAGHAADASLELARRSIRNLAGLKHPNVLSVKEIGKETAGTLSFETEAISLSLQNIIEREFGPGFEDNDITPEMRCFELSELEVSIGLMHVGQALRFLHENGMVHGNVSPETIFVTPSGHWKLGGFAFLKKGLYEQKQHVFVCESFLSLHLREVVPRHPASPNLFCAAPELKLPPNHFNSKGDIWAFGAVIFQIFSQMTLIPGGGEATQIRTIGEWHSLTLQAIEPGGNLMRGIDHVPHLLRDTLKTMLQRDPSSRPSIPEFLSSPFFAQSGPLQTVMRFGNVPEIADSQRQAKELSALAGPLQALPGKVQRDFILPIVLGLSNTSPSLRPFCLPLALLVAQKLSQEDFRKFLAPGLASWMRCNHRDQTEQFTIQLARHMTVLTKISDGSFVENHVLSVIGWCLESKLPNVLNITFSELGSTMNGMRIHFSISRVETIVTSTVLPRMRRVFQDTISSEVRANALKSLTELLRSKLVQKEQIGNAVFPALRDCIKADRSSTVIMACIDALTASSELADTVQIARTIVPMAASLSCEGSIDRTQFQEIISGVNALVENIRERRLKEFGVSEQRASVNEMVNAHSISFTLPRVSDSQPLAVEQSAPLQPSISVPLQVTKTEATGDPFALFAGIDQSEGTENANQDEFDLLG